MSQPCSYFLLHAPGNEVILVTLMFAAARAADVARCEHWFRAAAEARLQPSGAMYTALVTAAADSWMQDILFLFLFFF